MKVISLFVALLVVSCSSFRKKEDPATDPIREALIQKLPQMRECYKQSDAYRKQIPAGKLTYHFQINADGTTTDHKITDSTISEKKFQECVISSVKDLKFGPTKTGGTVGVKQPLNFYPKSP